MGGFVENTMSRRLISLQYVMVSGAEINLQLMGSLELIFDMLKLGLALGVNETRLTPRQYLKLNNSAFIYTISIKYDKLKEYIVIVPCSF